MKAIFGTILFVTCAAVTTPAGDGIRGPHTYVIDLAQPFDRYKMTDADRAWVRSLVTGLGYNGDVVHLVRTTLPLLRDGQPIRGPVYEALERPGYYYVAPGDAMIDLNTGSIYSPGVGGFSMHAPRSQRFIASLHFQRGGVPFLAHDGVPFIRHPAIRRHKIEWAGHAWNRLNRQNSTER